jgi:release factor glutamine methyltransferase
MTVRTALQQGQHLLEDAGVAAPQLTAEVLLIHAISLERPCDRAWLYAHATDELRELWWIHYGRYLHERMQGKPTQYITGVQEFYGRDFHVTPDVLIPRPETEHVIEAVLGVGRDHSSELHFIPALTGRGYSSTRKSGDGSERTRQILDIGTGSGAIAVTLALETRARVFATDLSRPALRVAAENARALRAHLSFANCDLGAAFGDSTFDVVASNPPYIPTHERESLQREVRDFEPPLALFAGDDGLDIYRRLIPEARRLLKPGGWLIMELGHDSLVAVREMLTDWDAIQVVKDLAKITRVILARST